MSGRLVRDIEVLAELFKSGGWTEVRIESEGVSLLLSNDRETPSLGGRPETAPSVVMAEQSPQTLRLPQANRADTASAAPSGATIDLDWVVIKAPNLGTFYRALKPGAGPFVEVGQHVGPDTEICLIEVMKLFTSVRAEIAGTVRHIAVADAELVEGGQALFYIERD